MRWRNVIAVVGGLSVLAAAGLLAARLEREKPRLSLAPEAVFLGATTSFTLKATDEKSGLASVWLRVRQGGKTGQVLQHEPPPGNWLGRGSQKSFQAVVILDARALSLAEGPATVILGARDRSWWRFSGNLVEREYQVVIDTTPPRLDLISNQHNVAQGGTGAVVYRVSEETGRTGVEIGKTFFPGYAEKAGGPRTFIAFFTLPYAGETAKNAVVVAGDAAGNVTRRSLPMHIIAKKFPSDTIELSADFLGRKMPEFSAADPGLSRDPLTAFLTVNREWRRKNHQQFREICAGSSPQRLWSGAFVQMRNTQNMANYAEKRTYRFGGEIVDEQTHLGLDLASTAGAAVPAANDGRVVFAGDAGIYGQTVILDHGQGLFSLYAHLSSLAVNVGQTAGKGSSLGASGQSGMAGGDHLHFAMLVSGEFVNPYEWLDAHWIQDNVENKLTLITQ